MARNKHTGSSFDDFLKEESLYEECSAAALKNVLARQIEHDMKRKGLTKSVMAGRMKTSRSQLDRLFRPDKNRSLARNHATRGFRHWQAVAGGVGVN